MFSLSWTILEIETKYQYTHSAKANFLVYKPGNILTYLRNQFYLKLVKHYDQCRVGKYYR